MRRPNLVFTNGDPAVTQHAVPHNMAGQSPGMLCTTVTSLAPSQKAPTSAPEHKAHHPFTLSYQAWEDTPIPHCWHGQGHCPISKKKQAAHLPSDSDAAVVHLCTHLEIVLFVLWGREAPALSNDTRTAV